MSLDILAILGSLAVAAISGYFARRGSLDSAINERIKFLLDEKDEIVLAIKEEKNRLAARCMELEKEIDKLQAENIRLHELYADRDNA